MLQRASASQSTRLLEVAIELKQAMRVNASSTFSNWLLENDVYPYNDLRATRQGFECKYIFLESSSTAYLRSVYVVPTSCFELPILEQQIVSRRAKPLTPTMTCIIDFMERWGMDESIDWHNNVIATLYDFASSPVPTPKKHMFKECISLLVEEILHLFFGWTSEAAQVLFLLWESELENTYCDRISFRSLTTWSKRLVMRCIVLIESGQSTMSGN